MCAYVAGGVDVGPCSQKFDDHLQVSTHSCSVQGRVSRLQCHTMVVLNRSSSHDWYRYTSGGVGA
jgi:hypothetical protein